MTRSPYSRAPLSVAVDGIRVTVAYRSAAEWADAAAEGRLTVLALDWADDNTRLTTALARGTLSLDAVQEASRALLREAVPREDNGWWVTARLLTLATRPDIVGLLTLEGVNPDVLTPAQLCGAVHALFTRGRDAKDTFKFEAPLLTPPPGVVVDDGWGQMTVEEMAAQARSTPGMR